LGKCKQRYVLPLSNDYISATSFDLWMFHTAHDVFALVINVLERDWKPKNLILDCLKHQRLQDKH
jgi:hypothetical protein